MSRPGGHHHASKRPPVGRWSRVDRSFGSKFQGVIAVKGAHMWHVLYLSCRPDQGEAVLTTGSHPGSDAAFHFSAAPIEKLATPRAGCVTASCCSAGVEVLCELDCVTFPLAGPRAVMRGGWRTAKVHLAPSRVPAT